MTAAAQKEADPRLAIGANDPPEDAKLSIADLVAQSPAIVLTDEAKRAELFAHIEGEIAAFEPDLETAKGRAAIKSFAFDITKTKTAIDGAGKKMNEDARAQINIVDAARRITKGRLEALHDMAREPLTAWEEAEDKRVSWCRQVIEDFKRGAVVTMDDSAETVRVRGEAAYNVIVEPATFGDMFEEAKSAKELTVSTLLAAKARLEKEEADRAELEKLRAEAAERERRERANQEAREAAERELAAEKAEEERRAAAEKAEAARVEQATKEAEDRARREAEEAAQAERDRVRREHDEAIAAERRRADEAEAAAQAERDRIAAAEAERQRLADEEAAAKAKREKDQAHRTNVKTAAKTAIMSCGADEETARKIVTLIIAGEVPHVRLEF